MGGRVGEEGREEKRREKQRRGKREWEGKGGRGRKGKVVQL